MWQKSSRLDNKRVEDGVPADQPVGSIPTAPWSLEALESFLAVRLGEPLPGSIAQRRFAPLPLIEGWSPEQEPETARRAAALLLVYPGAHGPTIALTLRHAGLPTHAGQISLPGGAIDPGESAKSAALREAHEEIGLASADVRVLGPLSTLWIAVSNFVLTPVVGVSLVRPAFHLHPQEVDALIELPMIRLFDDAAIGWTHRVRDGARIDYPYFDVDGHVIWGATAMVLWEFACLFDPDRAPSMRQQD
jgi:8-oxo-dGTP pyrophosphatase MutT (NUDIX family)